MISHNNTLTNQRGSALIVTMMLVSVLLMTALILLQRIVPYAKSVRSMHDASLAYYLARGQIDLARYNFLYGGGGQLSLGFPSVFGLLSQSNITTTATIAGKRGNVFDTDQVVFAPENGTSTHIPGVSLPFKISGQKEDYVVISANDKNPLQIRLSPTDNGTKKFGTSRIDSNFHTLYSRNAGGLRFDLRGVDTSAITMNSLKLDFLGNITANITLKMQFYAGGTGNVITFTRDYVVTGSNTLPLNIDSGDDGNIQSIDPGGAVTPSTSTFYAFLQANDCTTASICSLSLSLNSPTSQAIHFQLISNKKIPDLNAVVLGDGLSGNGLYYQRIIELIPTPQDI